MDFEFSKEQQAFVEEVVEFLDEHDDPDVFDLTRENMAQIVDTPKRRAFMASLGERGWLGLTWPEEYGGSAGEGVYEFLLNEQLAGRGGPQIGKGVGIIGKTLIAHGSDFLKQKFLPMILRNEVEFAVGYSEPNAGSDAASMRLKAERAHDRDGNPGWLLNGQKTWTTSAHFAEWYWLGTRTDPNNKHGGITLMLVPLDQPGITINAIWTMGDERTNEVFIEDVFVPDEYVVGDVGRGFQYISQALDLERFTMFTFSPIAQRLDLLCEYVRTAERDGEPRKNDPVVRARIARLVTEAEVARVLGLRVVAASMKVEKTKGPPPTLESSQYKLFATEFSRRLASASMDIGGPGTQLRVKTKEAPMEGRGGIDVPLHSDRHDRRWHVGSAEEHHRPPRARPAQELLDGRRHRSGRGRARRGVDSAASVAGRSVESTHAHAMLNGITVLDLASVGPAARASRRLADYGADVVKIGPVPKHGGVQIEPPFHSYGGHRGMRRMLVDLKSDHGRDAFLAVARCADVLIESFRPGVAASLGIGDDAVRAVNPRIVYCSTSGYGQQGPHSQFAGHDLNYLAVGGFLATTHPRADGGPPMPGATVADSAGGGMHAVIAILAALVQRASTGEGAYLDVAAADGVLALMSLSIDEFLATGAEQGPRHGLLTGRYACYDTYRCADDAWVAVAAIEPRFYANLCRALDCERWIDHQVDDDSQDEIRADFAAAFANKTRDEWTDLLAPADTCVSPVLTIPEVVTYPQFNARHAFVDAEHPTHGKFRQVGAVLAGQSVPAGVLPDMATTDTDALLAAAGYAPDAIEALREEGAVA